MKKFILAIMVVIASACAASYLPTQSPTLAEMAWKDACELSRYDCRGLRAPDVLRTDLHDGALGFYYSSMGVVYLRKEADLNDVLWYGVLVHEMVHYLQYERADFPRNAHGACLQEEEAFQVYDEIVEKLGRPDLKRPKWYRSYPSCNIDRK